MALVELPGFSGFERLGAGGLGDVYVATRDSTGAKVAIKVLRDWSDSSVAWVRTRRELQALVQLQGHPNVVHVEEVLESDGVPHIVMEFAPGGSVDDRCARSGGRLPLGYYNDPEKTAATFVERGGERWLVTGDMATVGADGAIELLGRGSVSINTGGEKVHPEEVEGALKAHPSVYDCLVVGVPDERWGSAVTAVVQPVPGTAPTLDDLAAHCKATLAGYKAPKRLVVVDTIVRSPSGKADYRWARKTAERADQAV